MPHFFGAKITSCTFSREPNTGNSKQWNGIPNDLNAATQWKNGKSYFFKNGEYYRFDDNTFAVDSNLKAIYPRATGEWWFGCQNNPKSDRKGEKDIDRENFDLVPDSVESAEDWWIWNDR